jgi:hypothetical protein
MLLAFSPSKRAHKQNTNQCAVSSLIYRPGDTNLWTCTPHEEHKPEKQATLLLQRSRNNPRPNPLSQRGRLESPSAYSLLAPSLGLEYLWPVALEEVLHVDPELRRHATVQVTLVLRQLTTTTHRGQNAQRQTYEHRRDYTKKGERLG